MNILIAEDEKDIRELLELHLIKEGFNVFQAENGFEALYIFQNNSIDLALLDVMMPGIDGFKPKGTAILSYILVSALSSFFRLTIPTPPITAAMTATVTNPLISFIFKLMFFNISRPPFRLLVSPINRKTCFCIRSYDPAVSDICTAC